MAVSLLSHQISDLCLGKPPLRSLPISATVADALAALKTLDDTSISIWSCNHGEYDGDDDYECECECECIGKISMGDVICYLCKDEKNLLSPSSALKAPVSLLIPKIHGLVVHVEPSSSLLEAIELMIGGAQNLVVPINAKPIAKRRQQKLLQAQNVSSVSVTTTQHNNGRQFCWLTQEDIIRFLLGCIGLFSPLPAISINDLGIINQTHLPIAVDYYAPASSAVPSISRALREQTSVAVVVEMSEGDSSNILIGEISPSTLACCDETTAAAVATLSAGDLMAYSTRMVRRAAEAIVCSPKSSLVAVMIQAITHRVNYVWVVEKDSSLVGIVTFVAMLKVFRHHLDIIA